MICNNCGKENLNSAAFCEQCGQPFATYGSAPADSVQAPESSLALAPCPGIGQIITNLVLAILFSTLPSTILAIIALYFRSKYDSAVKYNDIPTANSFTSKIKTLITISWIVFAIALFFGILFIVFFGVFYFSIFSELINEVVMTEGTFMALLF